MKQAAAINNIMEERKPFCNSTIPTDWSVSTVGEAFEICNNLRFPLSEEERKKIQGTFPYYGPTKIQDYINEYRIEGKYALIGEDGDHFLKWNELPMTLLVEGKFNVNNHAHVIKGTDNLTEWFFYYFNHKELTPYLTRQGAGRYKLTKQSLQKIPIALPNITEQKAITTIIRSCDAYVEVVEKLIIQKELRKKWLMQQLLTGKKRFKGFDGEVKPKVLGQFINEVSERNKKLNVARVLSVTNSRGFINQSDQFDRSVASEDVSNYKIVKNGQFAYNPSRVNVGSLDLLRNFDEGILSPMYVVFSTDKKHLLADFLYFHLKTQWFYGHIPMFVQGSVRDSLSFDGLCSMKFFIPTIEEQTAIIRVLQAADKEISLLKLKAKTLREKKKGLMQQLLTGKIRIK